MQTKSKENWSDRYFLVGLQNVSTTVFQACIMYSILFYDSICLSELHLL